MAFCALNAVKGVNIIMKELQKKIEATLAAYRGRWGMAILNHSSGQHFAINPDMVFPAASMIKIPIMYEVMR